MYIVGITVKISDYLVDNVPLGQNQGASGSVREHLVTPQMCLSMASKGLPFWHKMCLMIVLFSDIVARVGSWSPLYKISGSVVGHLLPSP